MKRLKSNVPFIIGVIGFTSYWLLYAATGYEVTVEVTSSLVLGISICLAWLWKEAAFNVILRGKVGENGENLLNFGLFFLFVTIMFQRIFQNVSRWLERPPWLVEGPIGPFIAWSIFFALITILLSSETEHSDIPSSSYVYIIIACAIGFTIAGINIGFFLSTFAIQ